MHIVNIDELQLRDREVTENKAKQAARRGEDGDDSGGDDVEEKEPAEEAPKAVFSFERKSRTELAAEKSTKKQPVVEEEDDEEEDDRPKGLLAGIGMKPNANRAMKPTEKMIKVKDMDKIDTPVDAEAGMTRKEKEALAAFRAKEDYQRRHMAGETEEARRQLEQLALVRQRREAAKVARELHGRAPGWAPTGEDSGGSGSDSESDSDLSDTEKKGKQAVKIAVKAEKSEAAAVITKKKAAAAGTDDAGKKSSTELEKLKNMDIKKMNGDQLKEKLKERNLPLQGQKKDLIKRLCDFEAARA